MWKQRDATLVGDIKPETGKPEYETDVAYWMQVTSSGVGFHDAIWQTAFGGTLYQISGTGSHGCINMPLDQAGAQDFSSAVVGVGSSLEASVLITANLVDLGVESIWAKATSREHGRILRRIGAHHVVYPEYDAGQRTAHLVGGQMLDYIEMDKSEFVIAKMRPPRELEGFTLGESMVQTKYGVRVISLMRSGKAFQYADAQTRVDREDVLVVSGNSLDVIRFSERPR